MVWLGVDGLMAADLSGRFASVTLETNPSIPARWWVDGNRVAWATTRGVGSTHEHSTVHLVRIGTSSGSAVSTSAPA